MLTKHNQKVLAVHRSLNARLDVSVSSSSLQEGDSAVILATVRYDTLVLKKLVRAGADLNLQNEVISGLETKTYNYYLLLFLSYQEGLTALMISSKSGRIDLTKILLSGDNISLDIQTVRWQNLIYTCNVLIV